MTFGGVRHVADIKVTELCQEAESILPAQSGKTKTIVGFLVFKVIQSGHRIDQC